MENINEKLENLEQEKKELEEGIENLDEDTARFVLRRIGDIIINEYELMKEHQDKNIDSVKVIDERFQDLNKEVTELKQKLSVQEGIIDTLTKTMEAVGEDSDAAKALEPSFNEAKRILEELETKRQEILKEFEEYKVYIEGLKGENDVLQIMMDTLINFGIKYGMLAKVQEEDSDK